MLERAKLERLRRASVPDAGNRVAFAIELTGKKSGDVAADLDMPASQLSDIKHGRFPDPKLSTLRKLADYFGCHIEDLFPGKAA